MKKMKYNAPQSEVMEIVPGTFLMDPASGGFGDPDSSSVSGDFAPGRVF